MSSRRLLDEEKENNEWMLTYADLMTLLLVFFVLLFSMSTVESERFDSTVRSLNFALDRGAVGNNSIIEMPHEAPVKTEVPEEIEEILPANEHAIEEAKLPSEADALQQRLALIAETNKELAEISEDLQKSFQVSNDNNAISIGTPKDGKLVVRISGSALFPSGSAEFNASMMPVLDSVVQMLRRNKEYKINIQGHTDDIPIETLQFPSNWELSAVRATTVLRYFARGGIQPDRVTATGYGDSIPLTPNVSEESRSQNRRLEFVLERKGELP